MTPEASAKLFGARAQQMTIHELLAWARASYRLLTPQQASVAIGAGALLLDIQDLDIQDSDQRRWDGTIPGALTIDCTVLEWRVDPASGAAGLAITSLDSP